MTQFNLADELRRGGTGLLAQAAASLWKMRFREQPYAALNEEECARAWLYARQQEAEVAAVPAGNQAKAPCSHNWVSGDGRVWCTDCKLEKPGSGAVTVCHHHRFTRNCSECKLQAKAPTESKQCHAPGGNFIGAGMVTCELAEGHAPLWHQRGIYTWPIHGSECAPPVATKAPTALDEMRALQEGIRCDPAECDKVQSRLIRDLTESREALARVEAERDELKRDMAKVIASRGIVAENERVCAVIEAARATLSYLHPQGVYGRTLAAALAALDQAASGPECAQKGHAYATNKGECCIYCFRPKAECLHMGEPASEAEATEPEAPDASSYWVLERRDLAAPAYVAANSEGYHGWTTNTASALRFNTRHNADCHRRSRGYDDLVVAAEHQDVSDPEATESATKETT